MQITQDVITDLWPIYSSGEASEATVKIVEEFLQKEPDFAKLQHDTSTEKIKNLSQSSCVELKELGFVRRTRKLLRRRENVLGLAIFLSLCPFTAFKTSWGSGWVVRDYPIVAGGFAIAACLLWGYYFSIRRRLESVQ